MFFKSVSIATYIVYCWGDNEFQQLGLNKDKNKYFSIPTAVTTPSGHQIQQVACGSNFTAVLTKSKQTFLITLPLDLWVGIQWGPILWIWAKDSQKIKKKTGSLMKGGTLRNT